ncbi:MAG: phosphocholine cytidylyltransferase family protein [Polyangiaceae bacterium]
MRAILLAAGRGRRLEQRAPKCLLDIDGKTLLERHVAALSKAGITALTIVVGYEQQMIRSFVADHRSKWSLPIDFIENPEYLRGSIVSLQKASSLLLEGAIYMDADVLYPSALMRRLVETKHQNSVLLDDRSEESGEEMMLGTTNGRVWAVARKVSPIAPPNGGTWDKIGEAVGFAKVSGEGAKVLKRILDEEVAAGRLDQEYEAAMNLCFKEVVWGYEPVNDFAWTEIDFQEDVLKARKLVADIPD